MAVKELTLEALSEMKKNDYKKLFKKLITWKKAKAVILLDDFKLDGKKSPIAIPFKKPAEMQKEYKRIRAEKFHKPNKMGSALFSAEKATDGSLIARITLKKSSLSPQQIMEKIAPAFGSIGFKLEVVGAESGSEQSEVQVETAEPSNTAEPTTDHTISVADQVKTATQAISDFKNGIIPAYQDGELSEDAYQIALEVEGSLNAFIDAFVTFSVEHQAKFEKVKAVAEQILPQLEKIKDALSGDDPKAAMEMSYKQLKSIAKSIEKQTKKIKKTVLKNLKKDRSTDRDLEVVDNCLQEIENFEELYEDSDGRIQEKLAKNADRIQNKVKAQMQQLLEKVMEAAPIREDNREEDEAFQAKMEEVKEQLKTIRAEIDEIELELAKEKQEPIPSGDEFLSFLSI